MEELSRTIRKLNGQITIISQRFSDILDSLDPEERSSPTRSYYYLVGSSMRESAGKGRCIVLRRPQSVKQFSTSTKFSHKGASVIFYLLTPFFLRSIATLSVKRILHGGND